jgi:hypothetical protein
MNPFWRRKLPTGERLDSEALRLGVSSQDIWRTGAPVRTIMDEAELQRRVLAARADRRGRILNIVQTVGIIGALLVSTWSLHVQSVQKSGQLPAGAAKAPEVIQGRASRSLTTAGSCAWFWAPPATTGAVNLRQGWAYACGSGARRGQRGPGPLQQHRDATCGSSRVLKKPSLR